MHNTYEHTLIRVKGGGPYLLLILMLLVDSEYTVPSVKISMFAKHCRSDSAVAALSSTRVHHCVITAVQASVYGYVYKRVAIDALADAIRTICRGT